MKEAELREHERCDYCGNQVGKAMNRMGVPGFTVLEVKTYTLDLEACQRQTGLGMMMGGNGFLAMHMGPNEDLASLCHEEKSTLCIDCVCVLPEKLEVDTNE